jgi:hypothetical protein
MKTRTDYLPSPIADSEVSLPLDLHTLVERLAENAHDVWAEARLAAGWVWGPRRCDERLHHPCLIPYAQLPESEKDYDRNAVLSTLKVVLALGYRIVRDTEQDAAPNGGPATQPGNSGVTEGPPSVI